MNLQGWFPGLGRLAMELKSGNLIELKFSIPLDVGASFGLYGGGGLSESDPDVSFGAVGRGESSESEDTAVLGGSMCKGTCMSRSELDSPAVPSTVRDERECEGPGLSGLFSPSGALGTSDMSPSPTPRGELLWLLQEPGLSDPPFAFLVLMRSPTLSTRS